MADISQCQVTSKSSTVRVVSKGLFQRKRKEWLLLNYYWLISWWLIAVYEKCVHSLHHDHKWQQETSLGKRVGLYRLQGEVGRGNFSYVKMAFHELTKGMEQNPTVYFIAVTYQRQHVILMEISLLISNKRPISLNKSNYGNLLDTPTQQGTRK